jgi:PAS domain S-box-containing protein
MMLDMRTIIFSYVVTDIVCMVIIMLLWQQNRKRFAGTIFWVFNFAFQMFALFLIIMRGSIPDWMSFVLANTMVIAGALLGYIGLTRFVGGGKSQIYNYILLAVFAGVHIYFTFVQPDQAARNLNSSVGLLIICLQCAWLLLYRVEPGIRQLTRGVGIVFGLYCLVSVVRIVEYFTGAHLIRDYLQSGLFEQLVLISNQMLFILLTYSLALMFNKRLLVDIKMGEEKFSKAFHSSPYAITITRMSDGQIIEVNDAFFNITGYQLADIRGKTTPALHLWNKDEDRAAVISELASKGKVQESEFPFRKKSGEIITGLFSAEIIKIDNEKYVLSSINDLTERKRAQGELEASQRMLSSMINAITESAFLMAVDGTVLLANEAVAQRLGTTPAAMVGRSVFALLPPELAQTRRLQIEEVIRSCAPVHFEDTRMGRHILNSIYPILDAEDVVRQLAVFGSDITERKLAEEALKESEQQYRNLFENSLEGIFQTTPEGRLISANMAFAKMFGYESTDEIIRAVRDIGSQLYVTPMEREKAVNILRETGYLRGFECKMYRKDGTTFWAVINARFTENQDGTGYLNGFIIDINDRKRSEEDILRLNAELEQRVAEQTSELRKSQLALLNLVDDLNASAKNIAQANQGLEATNKELEAFSYSVSHDLRAPLRGMDGFSQALLEDYSDKLDTTGKDYLKRIRAGTQRMGSLIDDMLKLSRVTRAEFKRESVDLSKMVQAIILTFRQNNPAREVQVNIQKDIIINGDRHLLDIALTNLIDNAWKFTCKTKNARIEFGRELKDGKPVMFIRDNGVGFDMTYVDKLFGAFQRLHTTVEFPGTGIGLVTVQRVIHRHGGQIWAEGEIGNGAVFYFTLP